MNLIGASHPNNERAAMLPGRLAAEGETFASDVEVYLEFQHRFAALNRADAIEPASPFFDRGFDWYPGISRIS